MPTLRIVMTLPGDVHERLQRIEDEEGMNSVELVNQAVAVWSYLTADERRILGVQAMRMVIHRERGKSA